MLVGSTSCYLHRWQRTYSVFALSALLLLCFSSSRAQAQDARGPNNLEGTTRIKTLSLRVVTHRERGSGTDNAVYFDIGPYSWKLNKPRHNDFEAGSDFTYSLKPPKNLTVNDILWLRLHKKGLFGVTGTGDGLTGAWHPASLTLIVNGNEFRTVLVDGSLNSCCWYWRSLLTSDRDLALFARSLRIKHNRELHFIDKVSGWLTTNLFKKRGISGWLDEPVKKECRGSSKITLSLPTSVCVIGNVTAIGYSTDGLETIDIKVAQVQNCPGNNSCSDTQIIDAEHGFTRNRYIRIENGKKRTRLALGTTTRICGRVQWDTDREGWWEIQPRTIKDLPPVSTTLP